VKLNQSSENFTQALHCIGVSLHWPRYYLSRQFKHTKNWYT